MTLVSISRQVSRLALEFGDEIAMVDDERTVTWAELERRTNRLARAYHEMGVAADDTVTISLPNSAEFMEACIAAWKLGATPQLLSAKAPAQERRHVLELAKPRLVVGDADDGSFGAAAVPCGFEPDQRMSDAPLPDAVARQWKAATSGGSTGFPKLIVSDDASAVEPDTDIVMRVGYHGCHLVTAPLHHNAPFTASVHGLLRGNRLVIRRRFDAEATLAAIERHRVTYVLLVPTMMVRISKLPEDVRARYDLSSLETVFHMAAPCPEWVKRHWIAWLGPTRIWELYGSTEAQAVTTIRGDDWLRHPGSVGRPVMGEIKAVDGNGNDAPAGTAGELYLRLGADVAPTYHYVGAVPKSLPGGWDSIGDIGVVDADGYVTILDRLSDMVVTGGTNVYPAEVERALHEHPAVVSSVVIGLPDDDLGNRIHAIVEVTGPVSETELQSFLRDRLAPYKIPKTFELGTEAIRNEVDKVRRQAIRSARVAVAGKES